MLPFFRSLFGTDFMPHLYCLRGEPGVLWLHVLSDLLIALAYFAIPATLIRVMSLRKDRVYRRATGLFILFITACGVTHVLAVWTVWVPMYRLEGLAKAITAALSVTTAVAMMRIGNYLGRLPSWSEMEREIAERDAVRAAAHEKDERFRAFVESVEDYAIYMIDPAGVVLSWNHGAERMKGYAAEEIIGEDFSRFYTPEDRGAGMPAESLRVARETGIFCGEGRRVRKDGSSFVAHVTMRPVYGPSGELRGFSKVTRDVSETRELETRFQVLLEAVPDAILMVNRQGQVEYFNRQAERMFGYTQEEILGQPSDLLFPAESREARARYRARVFDDPAGSQIEHPSDLQGMRKDGSCFPLDFSVSPLELREDRVLLFTVRDRTEQQRTELRFRALLEGVPDAILVFGYPDRIEYVNRRAEEMFGWDRSEFIGQSADLLNPERYREQRRLNREHYFQSRMASGMGETGEHSCLRKDGTEFLVESSVTPLETDKGPVLLASIRDITQRKKSEARFQALLDSAPDAMVISGPMGLIELTNRQAERLFGYAREEMVGQPVTMLIPEELHAGYGEDAEQFLHGDFQRRMGAGVELRARRKDGSEVPVEISFSPLEGPSGVSMTAAIRDVTERTAAARHLAEKMTELRQSNEALEQFAHIASHDLQEPLRMVASYTQLLAKRYKGRLDADADEFIGFAVDGTQRMKRLIEDLLVYSRSGRGAQPAEPISGERALQEALYNLRTSIEESHAEVTYEELPTIKTGELQLVQLFQNLVGNAIKYRGQLTPKIHVLARKVESADGEEWVFSVADNGIGIDPQYFDRVFVIFQRLHGHGEYEGTGIGLAICKRVLQQQGGRIWVESEPGHGSVFHFALPVR